MRKLNESDVNFIRYGKITPLNESLNIDETEIDVYVKSLKLNSRVSGALGHYSWDIQITVGGVKLIFGRAVINDSVISFIALASKYTNIFDINDEEDVIDIYFAEDMEDDELLSYINVFTKNPKEVDAILYAIYNFDDILLKTSYKFLVD